MYDQRNQQLQTLILSSTVVFAALSTIIIQGILPQQLFDGSVDSPVDTTLIPIAFSFLNCASFTFLFLTVVLCIEVMRISSKFMINRARTYLKTIRKARRLTSEQLFEKGDLKVTSYVIS